ncbi:MAG: hypothetical protein RLZZ387_4390 [Chloroflexota bacterium]
MAELIAFVRPGGQGGKHEQESLRRMCEQHQLTELDESFAQQLCGALGASGSLALFMAHDSTARAELQRLGGTVLTVHLPEGIGMHEAALGGSGSSNPQMEGQRRRESGGESTKDSGQ